MHQACAPLLSRPPLFSFISMTSMKFEIPCMAHIIVLMDSDSLGKLQTPDFSTKAHYILVFASSVALLLLLSASFLPHFQTACAHPSHDIADALIPLCIASYIADFIQALSFPPSALVSLGS